MQLAQTPRRTETSTRSEQLLQLAADKKFLAQMWTGMQKRYSATFDTRCSVLLWGSLRRHSQDAAKYICHDCHQMNAHSIKCIMKACPISRAARQGPAVVLTWQHELQCYLRQDGRQKSPKPAQHIRHGGAQQWIPLEAVLNHINKWTWAAMTKGELHTHTTA